MSGEVFTRRIVGIETEYGIASALPPDDTARYLFRPIVARYQSTNVFLTNGSRLYLDVGSHPEIATAECDQLSQLIAHERAGDAILNQLADTAEETFAKEGISGKIHLIKNNVDDVGNSFGCHENYLIGRSMVLKSLAKQLLAFMITRQLISGAGLVTDEGFLLSQRADHMVEGVSSATTRSRPIINTRDEPHGDSHRFRRMHIIVGDTNMAEPTLALKVGTTLLVLEMLEAGVELPNLELEAPIHDIRLISRDLSGKTPIQLKSGETITALGIQEIFYAAAKKWYEQERPADPDPDIERVLELWERTLSAIRSQDYSLIDTEIDWAIKLKLLNRYRERLGADWAHPTLHQLDLNFHNIRPGQGLFPLLEEKGLIKRWIGRGDITHAMDTAPATTRANLRGRFLRAARDHDVSVTVDWTRLKTNHEPVSVVELLDPFAAENPEVDGMIAKLQS